MTLLPRPLVLAAALSCALAGSGTATGADLLDAWELARVSDPQLAATEARRAATAQNVPIARANLLPQVQGSVGMTDRQSGGSSIDAFPGPDGEVVFGQSRSTGDSRSRNSGITLNQSLYDHRNYTGLRAAKARSLQSAAELEAARDQLMLRVAEAYFNVLTAIDALVFARAEERAVGRQLDQAEQRFEVGLTAITDVHEARARHDVSRAGAILAENALNDAREALAEITGEYLANFQGLGPEFKPSLPEPSNVAAWVQTALAESPLIDARELALAAAGHDVATARAGHYPRLSGFIDYGDSAAWGSNRFSTFETPIDSTGYDTTVGVTLDIPIFSGFRTTAQRRQAVFNREATADELEQQRRAVTRQTRNTYRALIAGMSEIAAREQGLVSAQSALEATEAGFEVGTRTIVDVLLSQQVLFQAQRDYSNARHNFLVNILRLKQSAGVIDLPDMQQVNRLLTRDAEAALVAPDAVEPEDAPAGLQIEEVEPATPEGGADQA
jgi:outer membrane protein